MSDIIATNPEGPLYIEPGHYTDLSNDDYHRSEGTSKTKLDLFDYDQSALEWAKTCPVDDDKLKTLDFGDACHAICLEPERLASDFSVLPELNLRTNAGKEQKAEFLKEHIGKRIITAEEHKKLSLMYDSVMASPYARQLLEMPGASEDSYYWIDPDTGVLCKCRPDRTVHDLPILVDVKTTESLKKFKFSVEDYRYYVQSPFYLDGVTRNGEPKTKFVFLVIQKTIELGRYPVRCVELPADLVDYGREVYKRNLFDYATAHDSGIFTGIHEEEVTHNLAKKMGRY